jgi:MYXO-CTERM domain-containing protein
MIHGMTLRRSSIAWLVGTLALGLPSLALAQDFEAGALIIPMDIAYQDMGMFEAFGLVYELLRNDVPVAWVIEADKTFMGVDFIASAEDVQTQTPILEHGYRGGPWVIEATDADTAMPIVAAWQQAHPNTAVHVATAPFSGDVAHRLVVAPTIAMIADGNQKIARKYMQAAGIPDSAGSLAWADNSPDMLDIGELMGPTTENHRDGALFDEEGDPVYCQLMSMHWGVNNAIANPEVVAEVREYLQSPTHFFAECQAVNAFENLDPHGYFLTENGFEIGVRPNGYDFFQAATPYAQLDGEFESVGGSEPAYTLPSGDSYKAADIVMITQQGTPIGVNDVWMTGFIDGICPGGATLYPDQIDAGFADSGLFGACLSAGKVSYLGGHEYKTSLPISANPDSQGARLFLNSLFEAPCATDAGLPQVVIEADAPATTMDPMVVLTLDYANEQGVTALDAVLRDELPPGATFVAASDGGVLDGDTVSWQLGNLGQFESGNVTITVMLADYGLYENDAEITFKVGLNSLVAASNVTVTEYTDQAGDGDGDDAGDSGDGAGDSGDGAGDSGDSAGDSGSDGSTTVETSGDGETGDAGADGEAGLHGDGGCNCSSDGGGRSGGWATLALLGLGLGLTRRRGNQLNLFNPEI